MALKNIMDKNNILYETTKVVKYEVHIILETFFSNHLLTQEHLFPFVMNTCVKNQIFEIMKLQISMLLMAGESI